MKSKITHFIYVLSVGRTPFYVGCSTNPGKRIYLHKHNPFGILNGIDISKIAINILDRAHSDSIQIGAKANQKEKHWIWYYANKGFKLMNGSHPRFHTHIQRKTFIEGLIAKYYKTKITQP